MPWKSYSRHCRYCGNTGPRMHLPGVYVETGIDVGTGYAHKRCLPDNVLRKLRQLDRERAKKQAALIAGNQRKLAAAKADVNQR